MSSNNDNKEEMTSKSIDYFQSLIDDFFNKDDYSNDNLLDLLYDSWCVLLKLIILNEYANIVGKTFNGINRPIYEEIIDLSDTLFLRLRLLFSTDEKYSAGKFIIRLKNIPNIERMILSLYDTDVCKIRVVGIAEFKRKTIKIGSYTINPANDIDRIYMEHPYVVSKAHISKFKQDIEKYYNELYLYDSNNKANKYPKYIFQYQRERFHQNNHSDDKKYIIRKRDDRSVSRILKPGLNLRWVYENMNKLSGLVLKFANVCEFRFGDIMLARHRPSNSLENAINDVIGLYSLEGGNELIKMTEKKVTEELSNLTTALKIW